GDVLAPGGDDEFLLPVGDGDEPVVVYRTDVARGEPAVGVGGRFDRSVLLQVAEEHDGAPDQQLTVVGDFDLDIGDRATHRPGFEGVGAVARDGTRGLRQAPHLMDLDPETRDEVQHLERERGRAAGGEDQSVQAQHLPDGGEHGAVGFRDAVRQLLRYLFALATQFVARL